MKILRRCIWKLQDRKAQILLPSVLLAPIFILVVYLLFEVAKVSMTKIRQQFALDNAAYSQMSAASTYLNAVAMVNGPLPYRVMLYYEKETKALDLTESAKNSGKYAQPVTIFDLFYQGGAFPAIGPDHTKGVNDPPKPELDDWKVAYSEGRDGDSSFYKRDSWQKENPGSSPSEIVPVMSKSLVDDVYFPHTVAVPVIVQYLTNYAYVSSIYEAQSYTYKEVSKNAIMFREAYFLNVNDCKRSECARQSAAKIRQVLDLSTSPFELSELRFYVSDSDASGAHGQAYNVDFKSPELLDGKNLFQFAYLNSASLGKLRTLSRGVLLEQPFKLPRNHFNINLEQKYKPYVRNRVMLTCPRSNNNCVWPNPLPKYSITLDP